MSDTTYSEDIPEYDSGMAMGQVAEIGAVVSQGTHDIGGFIRQYYIDSGNSACVRLVQFEDELFKQTTALMDMEAWAQQAVEAIDLAQDQALYSWGMDPRATGQMAFPSYIASRTNYKPLVGTPPLVFELETLPLLPVDGHTRPPTLAEALDQAGIPSNFRPPSISGIYFVPGVGMAGDAIRNLYDSWVASVRDMVGPAAWPDWREGMGYYVGSHLWRPGDPPGGYLDEYQDVVDHWRELHIEFKDDCDLERAGRMEIDKAPADIARERNRLVAGVAVLVAWMISKKRR